VRKSQAKTLETKQNFLEKKITEIIMELLQDFYENYGVITEPKSQTTKLQKSSDASSPEKSEISSKTTSSSTSALSDNKEFEQPPSKIGKNYVPLETKIKIVNLARTSSLEFKNTSENGRKCINE